MPLGGRRASTAPPLPGLHPLAAYAGQWIWACARLSPPSPRLGEGRNRGSRAYAWRPGLAPQFPTSRWGGFWWLGPPAGTGSPQPLGKASGGCGWTLHPRLCRFPSGHSPPRFAWLRCYAQLQRNVCGAQHADTAHWWLVRWYQSASVSLCHPLSSYTGTRMPILALLQVV